MMLTTLNVELMNKRDNKISERLVGILVANTISATTRKFEMEEVVTLKAFLN